MSCRLPRSLVDELEAHARSTFPEECCGMVVERAGQLSVVRVTNVQNTAARRTAKVQRKEAKISGKIFG